MSVWGGVGVSAELESVRETISHDRLGSVITKTSLIGYKKQVCHYYDQRIDSRQQADIEQ